MYLAPNKTEEGDWIYKYDIEPLNLFDQAMVDGRVSWEKFISLKDEIAARTRLSKRRILRSLLYTSPKDFVVRVGQ